MIGNVTWSPEERKNQWSAHKYRFNNVIRTIDVRVAHNLNSVIVVGNSFNFDGGYILINIFI